MSRDESGFELEQGEPGLSVSRAALVPRGACFGASPDADCSLKRCAEAASQAGLQIRLLSAVNDLMQGTYRHAGRDDLRDRRALV